MFPLVNLAVARVYRGKKAWKIRVEFVGRNSGNQSGVSAKFWEMYAEADDPHNVRINYGKLGSSGLSKPLWKSWKLGSSGLSKPLWKSFWEAENALNEKLSKGYSYAHRTATEPFQEPSESTLPGVLAEIHAVIAVGGGRYSAVKKDGSFVTFLTEEGVRQLFQLSPQIKSNSNILLSLL